MVYIGILFKAFMCTYVGVYVYVYILHMHMYTYICEYLMVFCMHLFLGFFQYFLISFV